MTDKPTDDGTQHVHIVVFSGLPGVGKSTVARELAKQTGLFHLRVDAIEEPFLETGCSVAAEGYEAMRRLARENLDLGIGSIIDCVNPWPLTRNMFAFSKAVSVEITCSDSRVHRSRLEARGVGPKYEELRNRGYEPWEFADVHIDSANTEPSQAVILIRAALSGSQIIQEVKTTGQ